MGPNQSATANGTPWTPPYMSPDSGFEWEAWAADLGLPDTFWENGPFSFEGLDHDELVDDALSRARDWAGSPVPGFPFQGNPGTSWIVVLRKWKSLPISSA